MPLNILNKLNINIKVYIKNKIKFVVRKKQLKITKICILFTYKSIILIF